MKMPRRTWSRRTWLIGACVVAAALLALIIEVARFGGLFTPVEAAFPGRCAAVPLGGGSEDIQIDQQTGIAYLSLRPEVKPNETESGGVMLLDLNLAQPAPRAALALDPPDFQPHGLSLFKQPDGPARLFAISHRSDGTYTVEILEDRGGLLVPDATIRDAAFSHPSAVAATGPKQFYLANDTDAPDRPLREFLLRRGSGSLYYYDGTEAHRVADGLAFPTGLALSPDTSHLYVGEALRKSLRVYLRDPVTGALALDETIPLGTAPDHLNVDADGVVWIAAHPKLLAFLGHEHEPAKRAPTQVLRFDSRAGKPAKDEADTRLSNVYENPGAEISAGSVAAHWRGEFMIGAALEPKVLVCKPVP
jgi:arylesterase/paraoxonase